MDFETEALNTKCTVREPALEDIVDYCLYVVLACKMEDEMPIICLIYIERLLLTTGILLNKFNWQRVVLCCLCLASKIWDDDSLENSHFPKVMPNVTTKEINKLEQAMMEFLDYKLVVRGSEYAKYYFILRTLSKQIKRDNGQLLSDFENEKRNKRSDKEEWGAFPLQAQITAERMLELQ